MAQPNVGQWFAPSPSASVQNSRRSSVSGSTVSAASTRGSMRYVAPALRAERNALRFQVEIAERKNELVKQNVESAKHAGPKLPQFKLPYTLGKDQLSFLRNRFPRTTFRCESDNMHDHPIAHTETMIARKLAMRMAPAGCTIMDLFGSPAGVDELERSQRGAANPKRALAYVQVCTEKDYLRALKWGPPADANGRLRYIEGVDGVVATLDPTPAGLQGLPPAAVNGDLVYFLNHTLYYLSDDEIAALLRVEGSRALAVVHRHPNASGQMFDGECSYAKVAGTVEQVNALTNENYVHRDLSFLWESKTKVIRTASGAFVWTFHMVSPETWIVELTGCNGRMDERFVKREKDVGSRTAAAEMNEHALVPSSFPHDALVSLPRASCKLVGGVPVIRFNGDLLPPVRFTCPPLFDFLCSAMVGKPRDADRLSDLFSLARSHVVDSSEFPGKRSFAVRPPDVAGHVVLAFVAGLSDETHLLRAVHGYQVFAKEHKALLDGSVLVANGTVESGARTAFALAKRVRAAQKSGNIVDGLLDAVDM